MPLYYINEGTNLNHKGTRYTQFTVHGLWFLSESSRNDLVERNLIREIKTLPASSFDEFSGYAIMIKDEGYETLGDFAGVNPDELPDELKPVQVEAIAFLHPSRPAGIPDDSCCG